MKQEGVPASNANLKATLAAVCKHASANWHTLASLTLDLLEALWAECG